MREAAGGKPPAVEPSPEVPLELLAAPADEDFFDAAVRVAAAELRSVKRFVEPRLAPRLVAAVPPPAPSESSEEEVLLAVLDEVIVTLVAL